MTNTLHFSEWRNCIRAQLKVNLCAPGAPKGPKGRMVVRQYEMLCANDAGRAPRKYPVHQHMNTYKPKFWRWFAVVCGGLRWFSRFLTAHGHTDVLSSQILVVVCGGLRWCVVVCGGLWWFAVVCGGLWWIAVVCLLVIPRAKRASYHWTNCA